MSYYQYVDNNFTAYLLGNGTINSNVKTIIDAYFTALDNSTDTNSFMAYSVQAEDTVVNSTLSNSEKQQILITMATGRYGVHYWSY